MSRMNSDATTYRDEMFVKFVMGAEPLANFDAFVCRIVQQGKDPRHTDLKIRLRSSFKPAMQTET